MLVRIPLFLICVVVSLATLINTTAQFLEKDSPSTALWLNPFNTEARINLTLQNLTLVENETYSIASKSIKDGLHYAPTDARLISLDGLITEATIGYDAAVPKYRKSLAILPTEFQALLRLIPGNISSKEHVQALNLIDTFIRRWPSKKEHVEPFIAELVSSSKGYSRASELFNESDRMRVLLISTLASNPATLNTATKLIRNSNTSDKTDKWRLGNFIVRNLFHEKRYKEAYLAFRSFLDPAELASIKYVNNGNFRSKPSGSLFDWKFRKQAGVAHNIRTQKETLRSTEIDRYLEIRFQDKPLQYNGPRQYLPLASGKHELKINYTTKALKTPKPIVVSLSCIGNNRKIAKLELTKENTLENNASIQFLVPNRSCPLVKILFQTDFVAKSWRNRFSGTLNIHYVSVQRLAN